MGMHFALQQYSKTSNNGPSEKRTTSVQRMDHLPPIDFTIELIHFEPPRSGHLSTPNNGHWSVPNVPLPIQSHLRKRILVVMYQNQTIHESASPTMIRLDQNAVVSDIAQIRMRLQLLWGFLEEYWHGKGFAAKYTAHQLQTSDLTICVAPKGPYTITSLPLLVRTRTGLKVARSSLGGG